MSKRSNALALRAALDSTLNHTRQGAVQDIVEALARGANLTEAAVLLGISCKTLERLREDEQIALLAPKQNVGLRVRKSPERQRGLGAQPREPSGESSQNG